MNNPMVFITNPMRHIDPEIEQWRAVKAAQFAAWLVRRHSKRVFLATAQLMAMAPHLNKKPGENWLDLDVEFFMDYMDEFVVLCLDGWQQSEGVQHQIEIAKQRAIPIHYYEPAGDTDFRAVEGV